MSKQYERKIKEGKTLIKTYKNSRYQLGKYAFEMLEKFKGLTIEKLSKDLKINYNTLKSIKNYYKKTYEVYGDKCNQNTFLLVTKLSVQYKVKFRDMNKDVFAKVNQEDVKKLIKVITGFKKNGENIVSLLLNNKLTKDQRNDVTKLIRKLYNVIDGKLKLVA
jgi:hypothetical protein